MTTSRTSRSAGPTPTDPVRRVDVAERRARLARRHRLTPAGGAASDDVVGVARSLVCLHGTDPVTVHLSAWARLSAMTVEDMSRALYEDRSLVKVLAMRRTLFVAPREALGHLRSASGRRVAEAERRRLGKEVEAAGLHRDGAAWLARAEAEVLAALADGREATSTELRAQIPLLEGAMVYGEGRSWGGKVSVGPRVLTVLSADGSIVRASNLGGWTSSRPRWASMEGWLGEPVPEVPATEAEAWLVRQWLHAFGPGTEVDLRWWLGSTLTVVRRALSAVGAVPVDLDGRTGYLLPEDLEVVAPVEPWAALLPALDPTTMGWSERDWYLGPHRPLLFDSVGNAGPTLWWDGRIVGGWRQEEDGTVVVQVLDDVGSEALRGFDALAGRLTAWLGGRRVLLRFPSPLWEGKVGGSGPL